MTGKVYLKVWSTAGHLSPLLLSQTRVVATPATGSHSGSQTPTATPRKGPQRIAKAKALAKLGVKIIEFDEHEGAVDRYTRDYCRLGCICDSLRTKQMPSSHCGKVDCMFACCCTPR